MTRRFQLRAILVLALHISVFVHAEERFSFAKTPGKLPKEVVPIHYEIEIKPDVDAVTLAGRETVEIDVRQPTTRVVMNANALEITSARLVQGGELKITFDRTNELVSFEAAQPLRRGRHRIELAFTGKINENANGMFIMRYTAPSGPKKMVATQFAATDARRMFPCFDEPAFRATFSLTTEVPENFKAVSNMPVAGTTPPTAGWKKIRFDRSPSMPTYLLVLVAGELEEIHDRVGKVDTTIWFTEGKAAQAQYALENSKRLLTWFDKYFGIPYPLPKLDHIAMPGGFGGAMEHWGGITYNEGRILFNPKESSDSIRETSFGIMAHEMAHQWFGNLVTMAWWDNIWLNEGFASWMGTKATDALNPDWNHWVRTEGGKPWLMAGDSRKSTHAIQRPVASELQIGDAFDDITYQKGMFFIRMLEDYLGEKAFQKGLRRYMKRHAYSNTTTADLWAAMAEASGKPVAEFATGWTEQPGLPVVLATSECREGKQQVELRQERFTLLDPNPAPLRWKVPVSAVVVGSNSGRRQVLVETEPVRLPGGRCEDAIKLNAGSHGYYRVAYDRPMFDRLRGQWAKLEEVDRVSFLSDAWAMMETGRLSADGFLDLLLNLSDESSLAVWELGLGHLSLIEELLEDQGVRRQFQERVRQLLRPVAQRLGFAARPGESSIQAVWRSRVLLTLGMMNDPEVLAEARRRFESFRNDPLALTGELRLTYLLVVGRHARPAEYDELLRLARAATQEADRDILLGSCAITADPALARRTLDLSLAGEFSPIQSARLVSATGGSPEHALLVWDFVKEHHRALVALIGGPFANMYLGGTVNSFSDEARAAEYVEFIRLNYPPDALAKAEEAADGIRYKAYLKRLILESVAKWSQEGGLR